MAATLIVVMGASGCGKSTVGSALAEWLECTFLEGDDYHPAQNREKMARGRPLDDEDRAVWLDALIAAIKDSPRTTVLACSALTRYVQNRLLEESGRPVQFCLLQLDEAALRQRVGARAGHFMPASLVASQLETLDPPKGALEVPADQPVADSVQQIMAALS